MSRQVLKAKRFVGGHGWVTLAVVALVVLVGAAAALAAGSNRSTSLKNAANGISTLSTTADSCGYSGTSTSTTAALNTVVFNESTDAKAISLGGNPANPTVNYYYSDEHALTLGATSNGGVVSPFAPAAYGTSTNPYSDYGLMSNGTPIAGRNPLRVGDLTAKDSLHRPIYPSAFVTDVTGISSSSAAYKAGDWQNLNTPSTGTNGAQAPGFIAGTWKVYAGPSTSTGDPGSGNPLTVGTTNGLGPNADNYPGVNISGASSLEKYTAETRWAAAGLMAWNPNTSTWEPSLLPGHTYRVQVIAHDGDQNQSGGDVGEACQIISLPGISTVATGDTMHADGTATVGDTATVSGVNTPLPSGTNKITFSVYGPDPTPGTDTTDDCTAGNLVGSKDVALNSTTPSGQYPTSFTVTSAGDYHFTAQLVLGGVNGPFSACDAVNETATVAPRGTSLTTDAGGPYQPTNSLTDVATLSGGTSTAGGFITFKLWTDDGSGGCGVQVGTDQVVTVNNGANGQQYSATVTDAAIHPGASGNATYHWTATYGGDANNTGSSSSCGATKENPVILYPHIAIDKSPKNQTIENASNGGGTATWTITVTNDGNAKETNVAVADTVAPGCAMTAAQTLPLIQGTGNNDSVFDPGESFNYTCSLSGLTGTPNTLHNVAVVTATSGNTSVTANDYADVLILNPEIDVTKNPPTQSVVSGGTASFTITVTNIGDTALTNVVITDALSPNCAQTAAQTLPRIQSQGNFDSKFDVGETFNYNCTLANVTAPFTNIVQACGDDKLSTTVCDDNNNGGNPPPNCPETSRCASVGIESMSSLQDPTPNDKATVTVTGGNPPNGNLVFKLYAGACVGTPIYTSASLPVNGSGSAATSNTTKLSTLLGSTATDGTYNWQITYSGDSVGNPDIVGACGTENFTITNH
jgi:uncharacterized repeat protein (TIGR01451 family)